MERLTVKTSTIFIAVGDKTKVYRSVQDIPPRLRRKLEETTNGINAATILIADRNGREEIVRALRGMPSTLRGRVAAKLRNQSRGVAKRAMDWKSWLEILLPGLVGLLIWAAFNYR